MTELQSILLGISDLPLDPAPFDSAASTNHRTSLMINVPKGAECRKR